jgi:hypothetical protein
MLKKVILDEFLAFIKRDEVKREMKEIMTPVVNLVISEMYPYIILSISLIALLFLMIVAIFAMQFRGGGGALPLAP